MHLASIKNLVITQEDLREFLRGQRKARGVDVKLVEGAVEVRVKKSGIFTRVRPGETGKGRPFAVSVDKLRVANIPVPAMFVNWLVRAFDPFKALDSSKLRFTLSLGALHFKERRIEISVN